MSDSDSQDYNNINLELYSHPVTHDLFQEVNLKANDSDTIDKKATKLLMTGTKEKKDPVIKITLFQCKKGLSISDIEINDDNIQSINEIYKIHHLDTIKGQIKEFMINNSNKIHEQIMPIYLILSNPPQIKLGEVINIRNTDENQIIIINPDLQIKEPMLYAFHHLHQKKHK